MRVEQQNLSRQSEYQRQEEARSRKIEEIGLARTERLSRLFDDGGFDSISAAIDQKDPELTKNTKFQLIIMAIKICEQRSGKKYVSKTFFENLSVERITQAALSLLENLQKYVNEDQPLEDLIYQLVTQGIVPIKTRKK